MRVRVYSNYICGEERRKERLFSPRKMVVISRVEVLRPTREKTIDEGEKKGRIYNSLSGSLCVCIYKRGMGYGIESRESQVSLMMNQREQSRPRV